MEVSLQTVYDNLESIDRVDATTSAIYRQSAQEVLADPKISLEWRKAISDRINHELTVHAHVDDDSY
jgi:ABC-type microcin C transport system duplicated ATPase subunit YejF